MAFRTIGVVALALTLASLAATSALGQVVVTNTYENFESRALSNVPVTFSRVGADGEFTKGITPSIGGRKLPAQVDVLRKGEDGSIRHALVSFVPPSLSANGNVRIDWLNEAPVSPPAFAWAVDQGQFDAKLTLSYESGPVVVSDLGQRLGRDWARGKGVTVLYDGPVMKEFEVHDVPAAANGQADKELDIYWQVRVFTGVRSARIEAVVERTQERVKGAKPPAVHLKFAGVKLTCSGSTLFQEGPYDQIDQTRYRILVWTDRATENVHRRPNYDYWVKGKFMPLYRWTKAHTAADVDRIYSAGRAGTGRADLKREQGILESGLIYRQMPGTGGRWDIGPYPAWTVAYLLTGAPQTYRNLLHIDGNGGGAFYIHVRQDGAPGYNIFTIKQPPLDSGYRMPIYELPVQPDHAHAPSLGYISYLMTGDKFYAEEMSFWASYQLGEFPHQGMDPGAPERAQAWGFRHVVDAAFILPTSQPLQPYFVKGIDKYMADMTRRYVNNGNKVHSFRSGAGLSMSGRGHWVNCTRCSTWMCSWLIWSLHNAVEKGFAQAQPVRDWVADYIIGFYTSKDEFTAPDGKVYRFDPKDAMCYSTAVDLLETEVVGKNKINVVRTMKHLDNYGEIWYYTKMNEDNGWNDQTGVRTQPDANGIWPLLEKGWGHTFNYDYRNDKQVRSYNWHRYGAWVGLVAAVEGKVPGAVEAWKVMRPMTGNDGDYDFEMVPRNGFP